MDRVLLGDSYIVENLSCRASLRTSDIVGFLRSMFQCLLRILRTCWWPLLYLVMKRMVGFKSRDLVLYRSEFRSCEKCRCFWTSCPRPFPLMVRHSVISMDFKRYLSLSPSPRDDGGYEDPRRRPNRRPWKLLLQALWSGWNLTSFHFPLCHFECPVHLSCSVPSFSLLPIITGSSPLL